MQIKKNNSGFTLIEIMIGIAIVGILAAIAVPSYLKIVARSNRAAAQAQLLQAAQYMQRFYAANDSYLSDRTGNKTVDQVMPASLQSAPQGGTVLLYQFDWVNYAPSQSTFTLAMVPVAGQSMANDPCGSFTITQTGLKGVTGSWTVAQCWR
jgi:type IV pilus assembly protein PilE